MQILSGRVVNADIIAVAIENAEPAGNEVICYTARRRSGQLLQKINRLRRYEVRGNFVPRKWNPGISRSGVNLVLSAVQVFAQIASQSREAGVAH